MITTDLFLVDGRPMLIPNAGVTIGLEDIESADSGYDESGALHRFVVRQSVESWNFVYDRLTGAEYAYMESLFAGKSTFCFTCPDGEGNMRRVTAYRSKQSIRWHSAADDLYRDYQFRIKMC